MMSLKRLFREETATAAATATALMMAAAGVFLAAGLNTAFNPAGARESAISGNMKSTIP